MIDNLVMDIVNRKYIVIMIGLILLPSVMAAQSMKEEYEALLLEDDPLQEEEFLKRWELADSNDAELYTAYFNFYVNQSRNENLAIGKDKPDTNDFLVLNESDTTQKEPAGYIYNNVTYDTGLIKKAFHYADKGIEKFPMRLDIRFGKIYVYSLLGDYDKYTNEIIKTIEYSSENNNNWHWEDNKKLEDGKKVFLDGLQGYILHIYETGDNRLLKYMIQIAETTLQYYPDSVESLTNMAIVCLLWEEYDEALKTLLAAEKLRPDDMVVLGNIAQAYKLKGDKGNAIKYYMRIIDRGDADAKSYAKSQIEALGDR